MRRFLLCGLSLLFLSSCSQWGELPSQEVMSRAMAASRTVQSANFSLQADINAETSASSVQGHISLENGVSQNAGRELQFTVSVNGSMSAGQSAQSIAAVTDVITTGDGTSYVKIQSMTVDPPSVALNAEAVSGLLGKWLRTQPRTSTQSAFMLSPDPRIIRAQAEVVTVSQNLGRTKLNGRSVYHYRVQIDPQKMKEFLQNIAKEQNQEFDASSIDAFIQSYTAMGEVWIDSESFFIHRISWAIESKQNTSSEKLHLTFMLDVSGQNAAEPITFPIDAEQIPAGTIFGGGFSSILSSVPQARSGALLPSRP